MLSPQADIYDRVAGELERDGGLDCECLGGGRIKHDSAAKKIHVYGYSMVHMTFQCLKIYTPWISSISWTSNSFFSGIWESKAFCFHREDKNPLPRLWGDLGGWRVLNGLHGTNYSCEQGHYFKPNCLNIAFKSWCAKAEKVQNFNTFLRWMDGWDVYSKTRQVILMFDWFLT